MNKCIFIGNVGKDPEVRATQLGDTVVTFSMGVRKGKSETIWVDVTTMGKTSDVVRQYVHKGDQIAVEGSVSARAYIAKDNTAKASLQLFASSVQLIGSKKEKTDNEQVYDLQSDTSPF